MNEFMKLALKTGTSLILDLMCCAYLYICIMIIQNNFFSEIKKSDCHQKDGKGHGKISEPLKISKDWAAAAEKNRTSHKITNQKCGVVVDHRQRATAQLWK